MNDLVFHKIESVLTESEIQGKRILEAGSRNVNGSVRSIAEKIHPESYIGIDMEDGPGVDQICNIYDLVSEFGQDYFDVVFCTETLEHVQDWILAVSNLKTVLKPSGILIVSVPVIGRKYHGYPHDYWRYQPKDLAAIFADMDILLNWKERKSVVVKMKKPVDFREIGLHHIELYSMKYRRRILQEDYVD